MKKWHLLIITVSLLLLFNACSEKPLLEEVTFKPDVITPNADGDTDLSKITFQLNDNALVSIRLFDQNAQTYTFRKARHLSYSDKPYTVYFGGVVDGYLRPDETYDYTIIKRMMPDGIYTWEITAQAETGLQKTVTGTITIDQADTVLPGIRGFSISPPNFSPNQDGIDDRTEINLYLEKDVESSQVYLQDNNNVHHHISENEKTVIVNTRGIHTYDWDGGIDLGGQPPEDGTYQVYAEAQDKMGQHVLVTNTLEIINAGLPRAYILYAEVEYSVVSEMVLSDTLCYTLTVENDSNTPIRTTGPWPGTHYRSDQIYNTLGWEQESGVFRVGLDFDTSMRNYPFRWGIGQPNVDLIQIGKHWYLPPFARSTVSGCVQIVDMPVRNPLYYWAGLIHEDVGIANVNNRVDPVFIRIIKP